MINYTAKYTKIDSGYLGQLVEWPEVVTEGSDLEECRAMLRDALREMVAALRLDRIGRSPGFQSVSQKSEFHRCIRQVLVEFLYG